MKLNSLIAALAVTLTASLAGAQTAPAVAPITPAPVAPAVAPAVDNTAKSETTLKKHSKKKAHAVSAKKHKAGKHKKKAAM